MADIIAGNGDRIIIRTERDSAVALPVTVQISNAPDLGTMVPSFCQKDGRWAGNYLGHSSSTIGGFGCVISCIADILNYWGFDETPATVNEWAKKHNGFHSGNLFIWESVIRGWPPVHLVEKVYCDTVPAPIEKIDLYLAAGKPVIVYFDFDHDPRNGLQTHYVVVTGKNGDDDYLVNDPWFGDRRSLVETYGCDDPARPWMKFHHGIIRGVRFYDNHT